MSFGIGLGDVIGLVEKAIKIYDKIKDAPGQIESVGYRLNRLHVYLDGLKDFLQEREGLGVIKPSQKAELKLIMNEIDKTVQRINIILGKWNLTLPQGMEWRFDWIGQTVSQSLWALGSSPKELARLTDALNERRTEIQEQLAILSGQAQNALLADKEKTLHHQPKRKTNLKILFVDTDNRAMSVVAMAYAYLVREWTTRTGNSWHISSIHSAGLAIRSHNRDMTEIYESLKYPIQDEHRPPKRLALAALFDNKLFDFAYKQPIKEQAEKHQTRCLGINVFSTYDYIFVFNRPNVVKMGRLREAISRKLGTEAAGKEATAGKVILLGEYAPNAKTAEIWQPRYFTRDKEGDGKGKEGQQGQDIHYQKREDWNKVVGKIKISFKGWLHSELGWKQPPSSPENHRLQG
ncbi:MAG: hypothetical protein Q9160_001957 [Pyrenula sp. 1 TL-2023]